MHLQYWYSPVIDHATRIDLGVVFKPREHCCANGHADGRCVEPSYLFLIFTSKAANQSSRHSRIHTRSRPALETVTAKKLAVLSLRIEIAKARNENAGCFAVFVYWIASGENREEAAGANTAEVIY